MRGAVHEVTGRVVSIARESWARCGWARQGSGKVWPYETRFRTDWLVSHWSVINLKRAHPFVNTRLGSISDAFSAPPSSLIFVPASCSRFVCVCLQCQTCFGSRQKER